MLTFFRFAWLFILGVFLANVGIIHRRARRLVARGGITEEERQSFTRSTSLAIIMFCLAQLTIQLASGQRNPTCLLSLPPGTVYGFLSWLVGLVTALLVLRWVWGEGGQLLARLAPALMETVPDRHFDPSYVRWAGTGFVVLTIIANALAPVFGATTLECSAS